MVRKLAFATLLATFLLAPGARAAPPPQATNGVDPPPAAEPLLPFQTTPEIRQVGARFGHYPGGPKEKADAIVRFIFHDEDGLAFEYRRHPTLTAAEAFEQRAGNCLTLVNLFIALARSAGLDAYPVEVSDFVLFHRQGNTVVRSTHVVGGIGDPGPAWGKQWTVDFLPDRPKAYRSLTRISDRRHASLYYNSVAVEAMLEGDEDAADRAFRQSLALDDRAPEPLSNYGVFARRLGDPEAAEERLQAAIARSPSFLPALTNLAALYRAIGQPERAAEYERRALEAKNQNPYYLVGVALRRLEAGSLNEAHDLLVRARRIDRTIPEIYLVLGRLDLAKGHPAAAQRNFEVARRRSAELSLEFQEGLDRKIDRLLLVASTN